VTDFIDATELMTQLGIKNKAAVCFPAFAVAQLRLMNFALPQQVAAC
jgi:hypothetical protein